MSSNNKKSTKHSIAILDDYHAIASSHFSSLPSSIPITLFPDTLHPLHSEADHAALITRLKPFTIISTMRERTPLPRSILSQLPNLRLLLTTGTRNLGIDESACADLNITYCGTTNPQPPTSNDPHADRSELKSLRANYSTTNEHTFALLLSLAKHVPQDDYRTKTHVNGPWQTSLVTGLASKIFGSIGLGRLGAQAAITARLGFGMRVICWSPNLTQSTADEVAGRVGLPLGTFRVTASKEELLRQADVVSLHLVMSERSRNTIAADELRVMKRDALLVNTSRGPLIDEEALIECCERGGIRGVALDVYDREPLAEDSKWRKGMEYWGKEGRSQVVLSPHMGYAEEGTMHSWYKQQAENVRRWVEGGEVECRILPPKEQGGGARM